MQHFISSQKLFMNNLLKEWKSNQEKIRRQCIISLHFIESCFPHCWLTNVDFFVNFSWNIINCDKQWIVMWNILMHRYEKSIHIESIKTWKDTGHNSSKIAESCCCECPKFKTQARGSHFISWPSLHKMKSFQMLSKFLQFFQYFLQALVYTRVILFWE